MAEATAGRPSFEHIVERLNTGVVVVDADNRIVFWNRFMAMHADRAAEAVVGRDLFQAFPELPDRWLRHKLRSALILGTPSFSSWRQRPWLFRMQHDRSVTGSVELMRQDCTFMPLTSAEGEVAFVGIFVNDVTETAVSEAELDAANQRLEEMSIRDPLTGLYNRRRAEEALAGELERSRRNGAPLSLLLFDVDHFKVVNDTHGHPVGDAVLRQLATVMQETLREMDIPARIGGEEFLVLMPETDSAAAAMAIRRLRQAIHDIRVATGSSELGVTVSGGLLVAEAGEARSPAVLIEAADNALYTAKVAGRDRFVRAADHGLIATE